MQTVLVRRYGSRRAHSLQFAFLVFLFPTASATAFATVNIYKFDQYKTRFLHEPIATVPIFATSLHLS